MKLPKAEQDLAHLLSHLITYSEIDTDLQALRIKHSEEQDREHDENARAFCYVVRGDLDIYCTAAIENVSPPVRLGLLLHEIGHIHLDAFDDDAVEGGEEVDVDTWAMNLPGAGYTYRDEPHEWKGRNVVARNVQAVSADFVMRVYRG